MSITRTSIPKLILVSVSCLLLSVFANASYADYNAQLAFQDRGVFWGMAWLGEDQVLVTQRTGQVYVINLANGTKEELPGAPAVYAKGQGGLLDVAVKAPYRPGDWIYFTYAKPQNNDGVTTLARAKISDKKLTHWQDLLVTDSESGTTRHFGSRIALTDDYVFFSVGDRGHRPAAQDLSNHAGSILRLHLDGKVPDDNPFLQFPNAKPEIWSYGHRNPQGLCFDKTGNLWSSEHGPRGGDEINLIEKGANFGWPVVSHGKEYFLPKAVGEGIEKEGMNSPSKVYVPSIAPGSLLCYQSERLDKWKNSLLLGALKSHHINKVTITKDSNLVGERHFYKNYDERIRALLETPDGEILFSTDSGKIYRVTADASRP